MLPWKSVFINKSIVGHSAYMGDFVFGFPSIYGKKFFALNIIKPFLLSCCFLAFANLKNGFYFVNHESNGGNNSKKNGNWN